MNSGLQPVLQNHVRTLCPLATILMEVIVLFIKSLYSEVVLSYCMSPDTYTPYVENWKCCYSEIRYLQLGIRNHPICCTSRSLVSHLSWSTNPGLTIYHQYTVMYIVQPDFLSSLPQVSERNKTHTLQKHFCSQWESFSAHWYAEGLLKFMSTKLDTNAAI